MMENNILKKYSVNFTQVSNVVLTDKNISLSAKGIYAYLFSKPDGWNFFLDIMQKELKESKSQIRAAIAELIKNGYIKRTQVNEKGRFGGNIYEFIEIDRQSILPSAEIPNTEKPNTVNHNTINNTNNINNTENNNNILSACDKADNGIISGWNEIAKKYKLPTITILTASRKTKLKAILTKYKLTLSEYYDILDDRIKKSLFLQGVKQIKDGSGGYIFEHSADWHADFDFFLRDSSFVKTLDNKYTDGVFLI